MGTTRPGDPDPNLPQTTAVGGARSLRFVINPLVTHVRAHEQSALDFVVDQFKRHRVTSIGEEHRPGFSATGDENGCVRMFIRDLCSALRADSECRFRYFVVEFDEAAVAARIGPNWETPPPDPDFVNRKAYWLAQHVKAALREVYLVIARIPEHQLEVVMIDHRVGELSYDRAGNYERWCAGSDLQQAPDESPEQFQARRDRIIDERGEDYNQRSLERDTRAATNFERQVLDRLGDDRALIYYGANHLREGQPRPGRHAYTSSNNNMFVRQLIQRDNGLSADDIYTIDSVFPGTTRVLQTLDARNLPQDIGHTVQLLRIFDVLRAEFPNDHSIGFDVDQAQFAVRAIDRSASYPLGELVDGCIYFRDLNSWNGETNPPEESVAQAAEPPELSITSVIPSRASPGNVIFIYGFVLTADTRVTVTTRVAGGQVATFPCSDVVCINENVIHARVPMPGSYPVSGQQATIQLSRQGMSRDNQPVELQVELQSAFRYMIP